MNTKTIHIADATDLQLDWLVAKCEGAKDLRFRGDYWIVTDTDGGWEYLGNLNYTTSPDLMWPIIERVESYTLKKWAEARPDLAYQCHIWNGVVDYQGFGPTSLIAAARCYVASKLGETVEIPDDLI